jgi:putative hydrolase of the HAD superfamily
MSNKKALSLITFDVDDTLYSTADFVRKARANAVRAMCAAGLRAKPTDIVAELDEVVGEFSSNDVRHFNRLLQRLPPQSTADINPSLLIAAAVVGYHDTTYSDFAPYADALEVLRRLKTAGYRLGIATEGLELKQAEKIIRLQIMPFIDTRAVFLTDQVGVSKANPKFYRNAAEALGFSPAQCLHVGDRPDRDVDPANQAGWITVLTRRSGRHFERAGTTPPAYAIQNFWDLLEIIERDFSPVLDSNVSARRRRIEL